MSITDELREWAHGFNGPWKRNEETLLAIADRIDKAHDDELMQAKAVVLLDCMSVADDFIELPKDADGKTIRAGDRLDGYNKTIEVVELRYGRSGWVLVSRDGNAYHDTAAFEHHHEQTVEDVLRNVVTLCRNTWKEESAFYFYDVDDVMESGNIAECAAKLRLAGEDA